MDGLIDILVRRRAESGEAGVLYDQTLPWNSQSIAEIVAALAIGNDRLESMNVWTIIQSLEKLLARDQQHYLALREPDDLSSFFGCGAAESCADAMREDGRVCRLYPIPKAECPNCREDDLEEEPDSEQSDNE